MGAQHVTISYVDYTTIKSITFGLTSNASGDASISTKALSGQILGVLAIPNQTDKPSLNFDLTFNGPDSYTVDHFAGFGMNLASTTNKAFTPAFHSATYRTIAVPLCGIYKIVGKNMGAANKATCILYYR